MLGALIYKSPGGPFAHAREILDDGLDGVTRYFFFRSAVQYDSAQIDMLLLTQPVVCDRYLDSTIVCHAARDPRVWALADRALVRAPTITFVLTARAEIIASRLAARAHLGHEERDIAFVLQCDALFRGLGHPVLDSSDTPPDVLVDVALRSLAATCVPTCKAPTQPHLEIP